MNSNWQNLTWLFFHKLSLNQNIKKNKHYEIFMNTFKILLPCSICRNHFMLMLDNDENNFYENINKMNLFNLTVHLHNSVNKRIYKRIWSNKEAEKYYKSNYLTYYIIKQFFNIYIYYNLKKGPLKTENLIKMIKSFSHIFPRPHIRDKLINFQNKMKVDRDNFHKWIVVYLLIIRNEMK